MKIHKFQFTIICLTLIVPFWTNAATYFFDPPITRAVKGDRVQVELLLSPDGEFINAIDGKISFPRQFLKVVSIDYDNSIVSAWIKEPKAGTGEITFAGIIPGGFDGVRRPLEANKSPGTVFTINFEARKIGEGSVKIDNVVSLKNDGEGTEVVSATIPFAFNIEDIYPRNSFSNLFPLAIIIMVFGLLLLPLFL